MFTNLSKKEKAISLRKKGKTYSEILAQVPVAKSTLSDWLRSVGLSRPQIQRITEKKLLASRRGAETKKQQRILRQQVIRDSALSELKSLTKRELWLIGVALYWAEGSKEKESRPGSGIQFSNSDPRMIFVFVSWLKNICNIGIDRMTFEIYIHENSKNNLNKVSAYWAGALNMPEKLFKRIYFKKNKIITNRQNIGDLYFGLLRVKVSASSSILRKIAGWTEGIVSNVR